MTITSAGATNCAITATITAIDAAVDNRQLVLTATEEQQR